jgi:hypothetical protein
MMPAEVNTLNESLDSQRAPSMQASCCSVNDQHEMPAPAAGADSSRRITDASSSTYALQAQLHGKTTTKATQQSICIVNMAGPADMLLRQCG